MAPTFVTLFPFLGGAKGHELNLACVIDSELQRRNIRSLIFGSKKTRPFLNRAVNIDSFFDYERQPFSLDPVSSRVENFMGRIDIFLKDLRRIPEDILKSENCFFFPGIIPEEIIALSRWLDDLPPGNEPTCILLFMSPAGMTENAATTNGILYRAAFNQIRRGDRKIRLLAHTDALARGFTLAAQQPVPSAPLHLPCS
ncbi:MAG: hypothetical protein GY807_15865, partial [Gammaproteobacteria bacterium]|nr:hypothetical protein [Gammaproteobacteria bacterium]